jgi:O-antigen/teichoic acid export membrane protein
MLEKIKSLGKDSIIYGVSGILGKSLTIFLTPLYTRLFTPSDYGTINLVNTTFLLATLLSICALDNACARWYYDTENQGDRKKTVASWFWFQTGLSLILSLLLLLLSYGFAVYIIKIPFDQLIELWSVACLNMVLGVGANVLINWYRFNRLPKAAVTFTLLQSLCTIATTYIFVVVLDWHIAGIFYAILLTTIIFNTYAIYTLRQWINPFYFNTLRLKEMLLFSLPMIPAALSYWLMNSTDAYFIEYFVGKSEVGLFAVGATLASGMMLLTSSFQSAWGPFAFSIINEPDAKDTYANVFFIFGVLSSLAILFFFLFSPELLAVFTTSAYYDSAWVMSILALNLVVISFSYIAVIGTSIKKSTMEYATASIIAGGLTIILDIVLIPIWGKEGSAIATVLAQIIVPIYIFYKAQKIYYIPYKFFRVALILGLSLLVGTTTRFIANELSYNTLFIKIFVFIAFSLLLIFLNIKIIKRLRYVKKK